ncbi:hypothetical protein Pyrfu_1788 [Pyrolobus fumarii 1A]|uniref:Uncharacterized protein n=1 Tax=Pyrolobus fumarii (strain DSM 11204 / 1A) TaxID=694429 RepID=G0ECS2_PYRF1|nr:hypothetical protein [Pyrolobus fumarii]AEM39642.1 hypothetical protein Pyrfu_1788 [Pyrolobus fumarii 1A]
MEELLARAAALAGSRALHPVPLETREKEFMSVADSVSRVTLYRVSPPLWLVRSALRARGLLYLVFWGVSPRALLAIARSATLTFFALDALGERPLVPLVVGVNGDVGGVAPAAAQWLTEDIDGLNGFWISSYRASRLARLLGSRLDVEKRDSVTLSCSEPDACRVCSIVAGEVYNLESIVVGRRVYTGESLRDFLEHGTASHGKGTSKNGRTTGNVVKCDVLDGYIWLKSDNEECLIFTLLSTLLAGHPPDSLGEFVSKTGLDWCTGFASIGFKRLYDLIVDWKIV